MDRRTFLETSTLIAASGARGRAPRAARAEPPMVGIQVGAVSFVDEGTDKVLDGFQEMAGINTLFLATFTYGRGIAGRQLRGQPLPDHGKQEYDDNFRGGNFATPHPQYYRHTSIAPEKAPDHPSYDVIADVLPAAHRRGMKVICWFEDVFRRDVPGFDQAAEIDLHDKPTGLTCHRNPNARNFWLGLTEDYLRSYDVDGLMWGSERQGPLDNALGASHGSSSAGGVIACFCPHCLAAARQEGINIERARDGYLALERWAAALRVGQRPADGAFVTFWRLLVKYPELLAWERLWNEGLSDAEQGLSADYVLRETKRAVAGVGPRVKIWPGIDIDIPTGPAEKKTQPEDVYQAVRAAFQGGAHGVLLSRKYSEMKLANIRAAGRAVRELKPG